MERERSDIRDDAFMLQNLRHLRRHNTLPVVRNVANTVSDLKVMAIRHDVCFLRRMYAI